MDSQTLNLNPKALERLAKYIENKMAQEYGVFWSYKAEADLASLVASMSECGITAEESLAIARDSVKHAKEWEEKARQNREKIRTALPEAMEMIEALEKMGIPFRITKLEFHDHGQNTNNANAKQGNLK